MTGVRLVLLCAMLLQALLTLPYTVHSQDTTKALPGPADVRTGSKQQPVVTAGESGFALRSADGSYQLKLRGYVQFDGVFFLNDDPSLQTNTFTLRRVRPIFGGRSMAFQGALRATALASSWWISSPVDLLSGDSDRPA